MVLDSYSGILSSNLFLQTPLVEGMGVDRDEGQDIDKEDPYTQLSTTLQKVLDGSIEAKDEFKTYIHAANFARDVIIGFDKLHSEQDLYNVFQLWSVRLIFLILSNELALAQREAKRVSSVLEKTLRKDNESNNKRPNSQTPNSFGDEVPLSLRILIIRLRSIGPNSVLSNEYYMILWEFRQKYLESSEEEREKIDKTIEVLAYGVSSNLIAKREYSTFLTHADSIFSALPKELVEKSESKRLYKDRVLFLATLVSLVKGDWDSASRYFEEISDNLKSIVTSLETILKKVDPVLDYKRPKSDTSLRDGIDLSNCSTLDDLFELIKDQRITGRILCSLCALFELQVRRLEDRTDLFDQNKAAVSAPEISNKLFQLWFSNTSKLYGFE